MTNDTRSKKYKMKKNKIDKKYKYWKVRKYINRIFWSIMMIILLSVTLFLYRSYEKYKDTLNWDKNKSNITMAEQSLDLLYDKDPKSKENKESFLKLYNEIIEKNGALTSEATTSNIKALKYYLENINTENSETNYNDLYSEVMLKYSLQEQYDNLFTDDKKDTFNKDVTPLTLSQLNDDSFKSLLVLYNINHDDQFVKDFSSNLEKFGNDVEVFNELITTFNNAVNIIDDKVTLKDGYHDNLKEQYNNIYAKFTYKWTYTNFMTSVISLLSPTIDTVMNAYNKEKEYNTDMANKELAYAQWDKEKQTFFNEIQAIKENAIESKRKQDEAEEAQKALEAKKAEAKVIIDNLSSLSTNEKASFKTQVDSSTSLSQVNSIITSAQQKNTNNKNTSSSSSNSSSDSSSSTSKSSESSNS